MFRSFEVRSLCTTLACCFSVGFIAETTAQEFPSAVENVAYVTTFSKQAPKEWGDDDNVQVYFFSIPKDYSGSIHLRVFDPDVGGSLDAQMRGSFNSKTSFSVYGGTGAYSHPDARAVDPEENYRSGTEMISKTYGIDASTDQQWVTLGVLSAREGEWDEDFQGYVFKVITEGMEGDDGNLYRFFLSSSSTENIPIYGANPFAYELCFRMKESVEEEVHFYPFIESNVVAVRIHNFDLDLGAQIHVNSVAKEEVVQQSSGDGEWVVSKLEVMMAEHDTSLDYRLTSAQAVPNDMVLFFTNQYGEAIPFFSNPIGGIPRYGYKSNMKIIRDN